VDNGIPWGPVGAVAVMLGLIEALRYALTARQVKKNGNGGPCFGHSDRAALHDIAHRVGDDAWSRDHQEMIVLLRQMNDTAVRMDARMEFYNERMMEHFRTMECVKLPPKS